MALTSWVGYGGAITVKFGSTQYETHVVGFREVLASSGGAEFTTADGVVHRTVSTASIVGVELDLVQSLASADLWRYMRENTPTTGTLYITGTSSTTEGSSNPKWTYTVTGWAQPGMEWAPGSTPTPTATFWVSAVAVDVTP